MISGPLCCRNDFNLGAFVLLTDILISNRRQRGDGDRADVTEISPPVKINVALGETASILAKITYTLVLVTRFHLVTLFARLCRVEEEAEPPPWHSQAKPGNEKRASDRPTEGKR
jgi:hypothetical protein